MKDNVIHKKRRKSEHSKPGDHSDVRDGHHKPGGEGSKGSHHGHGSKRGDHGHHDHHDGDHHSASSHPFRPRRDTLGSRKDSHHERHSTRGHDKHSTHHGADSVGTGELQGPVVFYENTYKMVPDCRFQEAQVKKIIQDVLSENLKETTYEPNGCSSKCKLLSEMIKERVKQLNMHRFKVISMVLMSHTFDQSMLVTSRCLWDQRFDNSVSVQIKRGDIVALGLVFGVYSE